MHAANAGQVDIRRITDDQHHTPRVRRNEFPDQIRDRTDVFLFAKTTDKRREGQNDDIVRSKNGEHGYERIQTQKQFLLTAFRFVDLERRKLFEKAELVQIHR